MQVKEEIQEEIVKAISEIGTEGATILEIEKKVRFERHTLSKYLSFMQAHGHIYHKMYGKAKVWFIDKVPIKTVLNSLPGKKTFAEKILSDVITNLPSGLIIIDKDYNILFCNEKIQDLYGNIENQKFYSAIMNHENPLKLKELNGIIWEKIDSAGFEIEDTYGNSFAVRAKKLVNPDKSLAVILILDDITLRKKADEFMQSQKALLEAERETLNKSAIVSETDLRGNITYANEKFCEISKYKREELLGKNHRIINSGYHPKPFFRNMWKTIANGKVWHNVIRNKAKDGSYYWVDSAIAPVLGKNGKPVKYISIRFDITKLKEAEAKINNYKQGGKCH